MARLAWARDASGVDRWIRLDGLHNARDVGGLPVRGGGRTRSGVLIRSEEPVDCTPADVAFFRDEVGLRFVIDVRGEAEHAAGLPHPLAEAGIDYLALDLTDIGATPEEQEQARGVMASQDEQAGIQWMTDRYLSRLDASGWRIAEILGHLVEGRVPALVHCAAGKDRAGLAVAMLLAAADVEPTAIVADYALTEERIDVLMEALRRRRELPEPTGGMGVLLRRAPAVVMEEVLASVVENHGGARQWFLDVGATEDMLERWSSMLVDPEAA